MLYVVTHKEVAPLGLTPRAKFLFVGGARGRPRREDCAYDDGGDNISGKNGLYSELTGLYYLWKNCRDGVIGVCHYRRFFCDSRWLWPFERRITPREASGYRFDYDQVEASLLRGECDAVLPSRRLLLTKRGLKTVYGHFAYHKGRRAFDHLLATVREVSPALYPAYEHHVMHSRMASYWNMLVARNELFREVCGWVFPILFALEERLGHDPGGMAPRLMGYFSESLIPFYIAARGYRVEYRNVVYVESL